MSNDFEQYFEPSPEQQEATEIITPRPQDVEDNYYERFFEDNDNAPIGDDKNAFEMLDEMDMSEIRAPRRTDLPEALGRAYYSGAKAAPIAGQTIGAMFGGATPIPGDEYLFATLGRLGGESIKAKVFGKELTKKDVIKKALTTYATELTFGTAGKLLFRKFKMLDEVAEGAGKELNEQKTFLAELSDVNPELQVSGQEMVKMIDTATEKIVDTSGKVGALLRRFRNNFAKNEKVSARALMEFKQKLGRATQFEFSTKNINDATNSAAKVVGGKVKNIVMELAERANKAGAKKTLDNGKKITLKNFAKNNKVVSKALESIKDKGVDSLSGVALAGTGGTAVTILTKNPLLGLTAGALGIEIRNEGLRRGLYGAIHKTGLGRAATLGTTEALSKVME